MATPLSRALVLATLLAATPLLARKTAQAASLDEILFAMIVLGDDRAVEQTVISQAQVA